MYTPSNDATPIRNLLIDAGRIFLNNNAQIKPIVINKANRTSIASISGIKSFMDICIIIPHFPFM